MQQLAHYQIEELLGEGAFASVYRAFDQKFERFVALKVLKPVWLSDPDAVERFKREAKTLAKLRHPHIVDVYDVGETGGYIYLAQLLVEGETLISRLKCGSLAWAEMLKMLQELAAALDYAHSQGIIHRDIKPANVLLDKNGQAFLGDFGLIRAAERSVALSASAGGMIGTPHYMAPEQWEGQEATRATDVYALSCVVVEMLTGQVLFDGSTAAAVMRRHLMDGPKFPDEWPAGVPEGVNTVLEQGLAKNPADRLSSANKLAAGLSVLTGTTSKEVERPQPADTPTISSPPVQQIEVMPPPIPTPTQKRSAKNLWMMVIGGGVLLVAMLCGLSLLLRAIFPSAPPTKVPTTAIAFKESNGPDRAPTPLPLPTSTHRAPTPRPPTATPNAKATATAAARSKATATTEAKAMATVKALGTAIAESDVLYKEDFSSNERGWREGKNSDEFGDFEDKVTTGKYRRSIILSKEGVITRQNVPNPGTNDYFTTKDFLLSVDATIIEASGDAIVAIIFRENKDGDYYAVEFRNDGQYMIELNQNDDWKTIKDWTSSYAINLKPGERNNFTLVVKDTQFTIFANQQFLTTVENFALRDAGEVGLAISVYEPKQSLTVDFDNLIFRHVPGATPIPTPTVKPTPRPAQGPAIPAGKGMLIYFNDTPYNLVIDVIGPTNTTAELPPGGEKQFVLEPGIYTFNSHAAGGDLTVKGEEFEIKVGQVTEFGCCVGY